MIRRTCPPRADVVRRLASEGMLWQFDNEHDAVVDHTPDEIARSYWPDDAYYEFSSAEIDHIEQATDELWAMCVVAAEYMLGHESDDSLGLPAGSLTRLRRSFAERANEPGVYARFDLCWTPDGVKMLEINGDTPTMLIETAISQWSWHEENFGHLDQFNSVHERLVAAWSNRVRHGRTIHFAGILDLVEEASTLTYLADTAQQAGFATRVFDLRDLGVRRGEFVDDESAPITTLFKLYPWEDMLAEPFSPFAEKAGVQWIEPMWRSLLSTKAILPALWHCFPDHPLLLPAFRGSPAGLSEWVAKPYFGREGSAIRVHAQGREWTHSGESSGEPYAYQQWCPLPEFDGNRPVIGSWVIDGHAAGMGIRETDGPITDVSCRFVPHVIKTPAPSDAQRHGWLAEDGAISATS